MAIGTTLPPCAASSPTGRSIPNDRVWSALGDNSRSAIYDLAIDDRHLHLGVVNLSDRDLKQIPIDDDEVREHPRFDRAPLIARTHLSRGIDGEDPHGLFERDPFRLAERFSAATRRLTRHERLDC